MASKIHRSEEVMQYKIGILTAYYMETPGHDNYQPLANIVVPNLGKYAEKNKYTAIVYQIPMTSLQYGFEKFRLIKHEFERGEVDLLLCTDLDVLITNHSTRIESFVDDQHDFYMTRDVNGINTGTFIIVDSEWSRVWIDMLLSHQNEFDNEQVAIDYFRNDSQWKEKIKILPHPSVNSYPYSYYAPNWGIIGDRKIDKPSLVEGDWQNGCFICHLPGMTIEKRLEIFTKIQEEVIL